jgi:hypothetical protein
MKESTSESLKTILTIITGLIVLNLVFESSSLLYVSLVLGVLSLLSEKLAYYAHKAWMTLAKILSYIMPNVILSMIFYLFLTPIALLQRLFIVDEFMPLSKNKNSSFKESLRTFNPKDFEKPW